MASYLDNFDRADGALGTFPVAGLTWESVAGSWAIASNKPHTTTDRNSSPIAAIQTGKADIDMTVTADAGDALYARIADAANWLRARVRVWETTATITETVVVTEYLWRRNYVTPGGAHGSCDAWGSSSSSAPSIPMCGPTGSTFDGAAFFTGSTRQVENEVESFVTTNHYQLIAEKCIASVVTVLDTQDIVEPPEGPGETIRIRITGTTFEVYREGILRISVTETAHETATKHGIGRGPSELTNEILNDFSIWLNFAPNAPTLNNPGNGQTIYHDQDNFPTFSATDPDSGDSMSDYALKRVISGVTRWWKAATETWEVAETFNERVSAFPALFEAIPIGAFKFNALGAVTWSVAVKDAAGLVSPYSTTRTFTIEATDPAGPTIPLTDPAVFAALQGVSHPRHLEFAYELLDSAFGHKAWLAGVTACSVGHHSDAEIKRTARLTLRDGLDIIAPSDLVRLWVRVKVPAVWGWSDPT